MYQSEANPVKKKPCKNCGEPFTPYRSTDRYCSPKCAMTAGVTKAKKREAYVRPAPVKTKMHQEPARRKLMKKKAKERDNYQCRLYSVEGHTCGFRREAHHIVYVSEFKDLEGDELWNLICLCDIAHKGIVHGNKGYWQHRLMAKVNGADWYEKIDKTALSDTMLIKLRYLASKDGD
jgi:hypothetical protein